MFTPLSKGSERAQDKLWDRTNSPRKTRVRPSIPNLGSSSGARPGASEASSPSGNNNLRIVSNPSLPLQSNRSRSRSAKLNNKKKTLGAGLFKNPGIDNSNTRITASKSLDNGFQGVVVGAGVGAGKYKRRQIRRLSVVENEEIQSWTRMFFRPSRKTVDDWLGSFWKRHFVLVGLPCIAVWIWVSIPFPVSDPYKDDPFSFPDIPSWPKRPKGTNDTNTNIPSSDDDNTGEDKRTLPLDVNFYFFLFWYFGMYLAVALFFITNLFSLYRLNWWPSKLGGKLSYSLSWSATLLIGLIAHHMDWFSLRKKKNDNRGDDTIEWERKTFWVVLSFMAMLMPALACFSKLKRDKRHTIRNPGTDVTRTFLGQSFSRRIPASWLRFLWFMTCLAIACFSLIAGQAYASLFLTTLPHTSLDAGTWVWSWVITVQLLAQVSFFILGAKVRSRALLFLYKLFFQLVYHVFYRNLFARLRSPTQFATVQLLSSISVVIVFPLQMSRTYHRLMQIIIGYPAPWEEYVENVATAFYCRGLAQNVTMLGFLGWLSILHFGPNSHIYPFFRFSPTPEDPYTFPLTFTASCAIWGSELISSFIARQAMSFAFGVNVSQIGIDEMREYPELVPACAWASVHVSMNILLFLIKLNFR